MQKSLLQKQKWNPVENFSMYPQEERLGKSRGERTSAIRIRPETPASFSCNLPEKVVLRGHLPSSRTASLSKAWSTRRFCLGQGPEEFQKVVRGAQELPFRCTGSHPPSHEPDGSPNRLDLTEDRFDHGSPSFQNRFRPVGFHFLFKGRGRLLFRLRE